MNIFIRLLAAFIFLSIVPPVHAACPDTAADCYTGTATAGADTLTVIDCSAAAINATIGVTTDGDTVVVPAGTCTWATGTANHGAVEIANKTITLQGAGIGSTIINGDPTCSTGNEVPLLITGTTARPVRVTGFTFQGNGCASGSAEGWIKISMAYAETATDVWRVDNNSFLADQRFNIFVSGGYGIIDSNTFSGDGSKVMVYGFSIGGGTAGYGSWLADTDRGTFKAVYVENNTITGTATDKVWAAIDCQFGGRFVFRYNTVSNLNVVGHGAMGASASYENRGCRMEEIYNNSFATSLSSELSTYWTEVWAGSPVIYNNSSSGDWQYGVHLWVGRVDDSDAKGTPWNACSNTNAWDGTGTGNADGYPCKDQPGVGKDAGDPDTTRPVVNEPSHVWGNTGTGTVTTATNSQYYVVENRDYCTHDTSTSCGGVTTAYTAYDCPHPSSGASGGCLTGTAGTTGYGVATTYTITPTWTGCGGTPTLVQTVANGATTALTVPSGYHSTAVTDTCGTGSWTGLVYTSGAATANCAVTITCRSDKGSGTIGTGGSVTFGTGGSIAF